MVGSAMKYKPDWPAAERRWCDLWDGRALDRPCIGITAVRSVEVSRPAAPLDARTRWLDPDWVCRDARACLEILDWGAEAVPSYLLLAGWCVCCGATPRFSQDTIWHEPTAVDFETDPPFADHMEDQGTAAHERVYLALAELAGVDDFALGHPCILPASDLLAAILGTQEFLLALVDHPQWVEAALAQIVDNLVRVRRRLHDLVVRRHRFPYANPGWMTLWSEAPYLATQADVSCMMSPALYERFVLPELRRYGREYGTLWYHLDGQQALPHLPRLLSLPFVRVIQYTPTPTEPPNGPEHLALYRAIQAAGKIVHLELPTVHVEPLVRQLDPRLLILQTHVGSPREGQELLAAMRRWAMSNWPQ